MNANQNQTDERAVLMSHIDAIVDSGPPTEERMAAVNATQRLIDVLDERAALVAVLDEMRNSGKPVSYEALRDAHKALRDFDNAHAPDDDADEREDWMQHAESDDFDDRDDGEPCPEGLGVSL